MSFDPNQYLGPGDTNGTEPSLPPAVLFGKLLVIVPNAKVPKDHIVFAVHPSVYAQTKEKLHAAFAQWKASHP